MKFLDQGKPLSGQEEVNAQLFLILKKATRQTRDQSQSRLVTLEISVSSCAPPI